MRESEPNYLERFDAWLRDLGNDVELLAPLVENATLTESTRHSLINAVNYVFKSLDLVPDGIDDIGYLDDAFVLRVAALQALEDEDSSALALADDPRMTLQRFATEAEIVRSFLEKDFLRLYEYVKGLRKTAVRARAPADIVRDDALRTAFLQDLRNFCRAYKAPRFTAEPRTLVKMRAFCDAKLPK